MIAEYARDMSVHTLTCFLLLLPVVHLVERVSECELSLCICATAIAKVDIVFLWICSLIILNAIVRRNKECDDDENFLSEQITTITYIYNLDNFLR